jgi:hypothetical protein
MLWSLIKRRFGAEQVFQLLPKEVVQWFPAAFNLICKHVFDVNTILTPTPVVWASIAGYLPMLWVPVLHWIWVLRACVASAQLELERVPWRHVIA